MTGIEFLEPTDPSSPGAEPDRTGSNAAATASEPAPTPAERRMAGLWWLAATLWCAAALLAVIAAYQPVLHVSYGGGPGSYTVDAWGRYSGGGAVEAVRLGARYGPVLCILAVVFAVLAGYSALRAVRGLSGAVRATAAVLSLVSAAFLAGLAVAMVLQVTSTLDSERAIVYRNAGLGDPVRGDIDTAVGSSVAFAMAALVCAALAAAAGHPALHRSLSAARVVKHRARITPDPGG